MKIVNGFIDLTWKEDLEAGPALLADMYPDRPRAPRWKRWLAPAQHWFLCTFCGHRAFDLNHGFVTDPIPGTGAPKWEDEPPVNSRGQPLVLVDRLPAENS